MNSNMIPTKTDIYWAGVGIDGILYELWGRASVGPNVLWCLWHIRKRVRSIGWCRYL